MKIQIQKSTLLGALRKVVPFINPRNQLPLLQNALFSADKAKGILTITGTDLEKTIVVTVACDSIEKSGTTTLPVKLLAEIAAKVADGPVTIEVGEGERAMISAGQSKFRVLGIAKDQFPQLPKVDNQKSITVESAELVKMIKRVVYAASKDDANRRALCSVLVKIEPSGKMTLVSTDGRRLALTETQLDQNPDHPEEDVQLIIPVPVMNELVKVLADDERVEITSVRTQAAFKIGGTTLYTKLYDESYPNYLGVIPKTSTGEIEIDRQLLIDAIDRASVFAAGEGSAVVLVFEKGQLRIMSEESEMGEACDVIPIKYDGEKVIRTRFNPAYIIAPLRVIDDDTVRYCTSDGLPVVIRCSEKMLSVLMPLRD